MDLRRFFENRFNSQSISDDRLRLFTEDHLQRLEAANTDNRFATMINATRTAYEDYFGAITAEDGHLARQQSMTRAKNKVVREFKQTIRQKEGIIRGTWGLDSPEYRAFFPRGLSEYHRANMSNVENLMARVINLATEHAEQLGEEFVNLFTQLRERFVAARTAQLKKFGEVSDSKHSTRQQREALTRQLMTNLLNLAVIFIDEPRRSTDFFDQSLLRASRRNSNGTTDHQPQPVEETQEN